MFGLADPETFPLQKKRHSDEFLRTIAHLRSRTNKYGAAFRIRAEAAHAVHDFFYQNGDGHPNCYDNINRALGEHRPIIQPVNLFMHTTVDGTGKITIHPPVSKAGNKIVLQAQMDVRLGIAACSVSEGACNNRVCSPIRVIVDSQGRKIVEEQI